MSATKEHSAALVLFDALAAAERARDEAVALLREVRDACAWAPCPHVAQTMKRIDAYISAQERNEE